MKKVQFIISGWHFDQFPTFATQLAQLKNENENINVFWSCHRSPNDFIKENFNYKVFPNLGLEDGAYQQALYYLDIQDPETVIFFMHDDLEVLDWYFIPFCIELLDLGHAKFIGNGRNYPLHMSPMDVVKDGKTYRDFAKKETKDIFFKEEYKDKIFTETIRESFICTKYEYIQEIGGFEVIWEEPVADENGKFHIGAIGNVQQSMLGYKISLQYDNAIFYLSDTYQKSKYIYECARGKY
jgi:hypothetical protein